MQFPGDSVVMNLLANSGDAVDMGLISGLRRCPGVRNGNPLQYSCLGSPMNRGVWWAIMQRVAELDTTELACMPFIYIVRTMHKIFSFLPSCSLLS